MFNTQNTKPRRPTDCYCRGAGICDRNHHICEDCTCGRDGAPQESVYGYANPTTAKEAAWAEKLEANR